MLWFVLACEQVPEVEEPPMVVVESRNEETEFSFGDSIFPSDFPAESDLTLLLDLYDKALVQSTTRTSTGTVFLPRDWVQEVSRAYFETDVEDALMLENSYSEWRMVSMRIVPCNPLGITPDQSIDQLCWPMVRLVWQPVVEDAFVFWREVDYYADDRAIHALYPLQARDEQGAAYDSIAKKMVEDDLKQGALSMDIADDLREQFLRERDTTVMWLLQQTFGLRSTSLDRGSWDGFDVRAELYADSMERRAFEERLLQFLDQTATPDRLTELTSFSLPEGRSPSVSDMWVFVAFEGRNGSISQKDIEVIDRDTGEVLINVGKSELATMNSADPIIEDEIASGNRVLKNSVVLDTNGADELMAQIADPSEFLVSNTSCASCHKLNETRFDFHNLSHLEDLDATVSPRVVNDVAREIAWTKIFLW